jgi:hypothetical protein
MRRLLLDVEWDDPAFIQKVRRHALPQWFPKTNLAVLEHVPKKLQTFSIEDML